MGDCDGGGAFAGTGGIALPRLLAQAAEGLMFSHLGEGDATTATERDGIALAAG